MSGRLVRWGLSLARLGVRRTARPTLVVIRHHRVYGDDERPLYRLGVSESVFRAQLALFRQLGMVPVSVREGLEQLAAGRPGRWLALTFDDGYADNVARALPLLRAFGARATFYLTAGLIEERRAPWWDELAHVLEGAAVTRSEFDEGGSPLSLVLDTPAGRARALGGLIPRLRAPLEVQSARLGRLREVLGVHDPAPCALATWGEAARLAEAGMEIGAHTMSHPFLSLHPPERQRAEIQDSIEMVARRLGVRAAGLAYPGGDHDGATLDAAAASGLEYAVTTRAGDNGPEQPRLELRRRGLSEGACLGPGGRFSERLARAELEGAFDRLRGVEDAA